MSETNPYESPSAPEPVEQVAAGRSRAFALAVCGWVAGGFAGGVFLTLVIVEHRPFAGADWAIRAGIAALIGATAFFVSWIRVRRAFGHLDTIDAKRRDLLESVAAAREAKRSSSPR